MEQIRRELLRHPEGHFASCDNEVNYPTMAFDGAILAGFHPCVNAIGEIPRRHAIEADVVPIVLDAGADPGYIAEVCQDGIAAVFEEGFDELVAFEEGESPGEVTITAGFELAEEDDS